MLLRSRSTMRRGRAGLLLALGAVIVTACGTRLPDQDFTLNAQGSPVPGAASTGGTTTGGGTTGGSGTTTTGGSGAGSTTGFSSSGGTTTGGTSGGSATTTGSTTGGTTGKGSSSSTSGSTGGGGGNLFAGACGPGPGGKASDTGVGSKSITIGNMSSKTNPFGGDQFVPNYYGLRAFVLHCNGVGGINGRKLNLQFCNDGGSTSGNVSCSNSLINNSKVFAFVANNVFTYGGASIVAQKGVPDIGGEPIDGKPYYTYPHFYNIYGDGYPKDGKNPGYKGKYWGTGELGYYFKHVQHVSKVGVVYYTEKDSQRGADEIKASLGTAGIKVTLHSVNLADPNYQAAVVAMQNEGDQMVFDALDTAGNEQLCSAMNSRNYIPKAKVSTISTWTSDVGSQFSGKCRDIVWSNGKSASYSDNSNPTVAQFNQDWQNSQAPIAEAQWAVEGYAAGIWFAQAARSCGANLTRACVEHWLDTQKSLTANGLMSRDINFINKSYTGSELDCVEVVKWDQAKNGWDTLASINKNCYRTHYYSYPITG